MKTNNNRNNASTFVLGIIPFCFRASSYTERSNHKIVWILCLCVIVLVCVYYYTSKYSDNKSHQQENFDIVPSIDFYVITIGNPTRETNIQTQIEQQLEIMRGNHNKADYFDFTIRKVDGFIGKTLDLDALIQQNILFPGIYEDMDPKWKHITTSFNENMENRKNEVGCYLSHYKVYEMIRDQGNPQGYSVIFEDDFTLDPQFMNILDETLIKMGDTDFDMLFLGIIGDNGEQILDNVYRTTGVSWCAHGYLVNNRHIEKIVEKMRYINNILDVQIFKKANRGELNVLRLDPTIVQQGELGTNIRNHSV